MNTNASKAATSNLMKDSDNQDNEDFSSWDRLWPITDRFEALCISLKIGVPSYERIPKALVIEAFNAIDPDLLSPEQAEEWRYFKTMEKAEFNKMFGELYNPFRLSERQQH
ncbi:MAG: hypothetical protein ACR2PZ_03085 [Pseudomonadales bacterium]